MNPDRPRSITLVPGEPHELDEQIDALALRLGALVRARKFDRMAAARRGFVMTPEHRARISASMKAHHARTKAALGRS